jgi:hypothetical protein
MLPSRLKADVRWHSPLWKQRSFRNILRGHWINPTIAQPEW